MQNNIYQAIIGVLTISLISVMYLLYNNENDLPNHSNNQQIQNNNLVDIKDIQKSSHKQMIAYVPQKIDNLKIDTNFIDLNSMLEKTRGMLQDYNKNNKNIIIKNKDIEKLVSLDFQHPQIKNKKQLENINIKEQIDNKNKNDINTNNSNSLNTSSSVTIISNSNVSDRSNIDEVQSDDQVDDTQTQNIDEDINSEILDFKAQIDEVQKNIDEISSSES